MSGVPVNALQAVLRVFDRLEIPHMVGGSTASSIHGWPRMTRDVDMVAMVRHEDVDLLVAELQGG